MKNDTPRTVLIEDAAAIIDQAEASTRTGSKPHRHRIIAQALADAGMLVAAPAALADAAAARQYLEAHGTPAPTLHPRGPGTGTASHEWWNGWNVTAATGIDAAGQSVVLCLWHFASGRVDEEGSLAGQVGHLGTGAWERAGIVFPVVAMPATSTIRYPEYTPTEETRP